MAVHATLHRLRTQQGDDRIQAEIRLAAELLAAFPELTRSQALKRAAEKLEGESH